MPPDDWSPPTTSVPDAHSAETGLPPRLEELAQGIPLAELRSAFESLSASYRSGEVPRMSPVTALAYSVARLPATHGAACAAFRAVRAARPAFRPVSQLDLGCGPGSALLAAASQWPSVADQVGIDRDREMLRVAGALTGLPADRLRHLDLTAATTASTAFLSHDLVTAAYSLGELEPEDARAALGAAWSAVADGGVLVVVEPGTPDGFARICAWRADLIAEDGHVIAPCPHDATCPMAERAGDWCHFSARVARSPLHRRLKSASAPYEDEPFSYVAVTRGTTPPNRPRARVVRHPWRGRGRVRLTTCEGTGSIEERTISRRDAEYLRASRANWGSAL